MPASTLYAGENFSVGSTIFKVVRFDPSTGGWMVQPTSDIHGNPLPSLNAITYFPNSTDPNGDLLLKLTADLAGPSTVSSGTGSSSISSTNNSTDASSQPSSGNATAAPGGVLNQIGSYAGYLASFNAIASSEFITSHLPDAIINAQGGGILGSVLSSPIFSGALAGVSLLGVFQGVQGLLSGKFNPLSLLTTGLSFYSAIHSLLALGLTGPWAAAILAAVVLAAILLKLFSKPKDQALGTGDINSAVPGTAVSSASTGAAPSGWLGSLPAGNVIFLLSGLPLISMGINLTSVNPAAYQYVNIPTVSIPSLDRALSSATGQGVTGNPVGNVYVLKDPKGGPTRAVIVSPGTGGDTLQVVSLDNNGNIVGPYAPNAGYVPLTTPAQNGTFSYNPQAVKSLYTQTAGLKLARSERLSASERMAALRIAGPASKFVIKQ